MQLQGEIDDLAFSPSFNCYFTDSLTATAAMKVSREFKHEQAAQFHEFISDVDEEEFGFSLALSDDEVSGKQIDLQNRQFVFPVFDSELLTKPGTDLVVEKIDDASSVKIQFQKLLADEHEGSASSSSSEAGEVEVRPSGMFCMWRPKNDVVSSALTKCKKSSSTGSGSKKWRIRNVLRRNNSEGKESMIFSPSLKRNVNSDEVTKVARNLKTASSPSVHELFYVQKRAEQKGYKTKSFLPYRQDLLGLFVNINRNGNKKLGF